MEENKNNIFSRRSFLKGLTLAVAGTALGYSSPLTAATQSPRTLSSGGFPDLKFNANGKFRIMQFTDTHVVSDNTTAKRALDNIREMLDKERPDLIIHTGDIIFSTPAKENLKKVAEVLESFEIPWAVALGNHDEEFGLSRNDVYDYLLTFDHNINTPRIEGIDGASNGLITLSGHEDGKKKWILYLFDTGNRYNGGWGSMQPSQINWYVKESTRLRKENGGSPLPAMSFNHIPFCEYKNAFDTKSPKFKGTFREEICSPNTNTGIYEQIRNMGDIRTMVCGHDHDNDFIAQWDNHYFIYGRFSGCNSVYNNLKPNGCRMFELTENSESYRTYIRVFGDHIVQDVLVPDDFLD